jgi:hypothetical protein
MVIVTLLVAAGVGILGWKAGRRYQKWRSGPGWKKQLRD